MAVATTRVTLDEFLQLPEEKPALEYFDGMVSQKMSPKMRHATVQARLAGHINAAVGHARTALAVTEARATFAGESVVPDVSVYRWDRLPRTTNGMMADESPIPPDVAVEIISPSQSPNALFRRCRWYVSNGVQIALQIDPDDESVIVFYPDGTTQAWRGSDRIDLDSVASGFEMTVDDLFAPLRADPTAEA